MEKAFICDIIVVQKKFQWTQKTTMWKMELFQTANERGKYRLPKEWCVRDENTMR